MRTISTQIIFSKLHIQYTSQGYYYYMTTRKKGDANCASIHSRKASLSQGYPEDIIGCLGWGRGGNGSSRRNNHLPRRK